MGPIHRVVVADDQAVIRESLSALFTAQPDFEVVGEAADGLSAIQAVRRLKPDLTLLDLAMPRLGGREAIPGIKLAHPPAKVLVLTAQPAEEALLACLHAGADGYLTKAAEFDELLLAARRVVQGHAYVTPQICAPLIQGYLKGREGAGCPSSFDALSEEQKMYLSFLSEGRPQWEIEELLSLSPEAAEKNTALLRESLGIRTFDGLAAYAKFTQSKK